jgi:hypothetical protein
LAEGRRHIPPARVSSGLALDWRRNRLLVFGGTEAFTVTPPAGDLWAFDLETEEWSSIYPRSGASPEPGLARSGPITIYDPVLDRLVISHGLETGKGLLDRWAYDFETNEWSKLHDAKVPDEPNRRWGWLYAFDGDESGPAAA